MLASEGNSGEEDVVRVDEESWCPDLEEEVYEGIQLRPRLPRVRVETIGEETEGLPVIHGAVPLSYGATQSEGITVLTLEEVSHAIILASWANLVFFGRGQFRRDVCIHSKYAHFDDILQKRYHFAKENDPIGTCFHLIR